MILASLWRLGKRLIVMVGGEAAQSAFHLGLNLVLLHFLPARDYGVFAIVMVIGGVGLTYTRALTAMPASIFIGASRSARAADAYDVTFGSGALGLSVLLGATTTFALRFWLGSSAVADGLFVGLWSLRSHLRTAIFARGRSAPVAVGDGVYTASGALLAGLLMATAHEERLGGTLAVLATANALGIAAMLLVARRPIRISFRASVRRRFRALWRQLGWSFVSVTTTTLQGQGLPFLVAVMAGPAAYAPIAATLVFFAPLRIVSTALVNLVQPIVSAHLARGEVAKVRQQSLAWTAALGCVALVFGGIMSVLLPLVKVGAFDGSPVRLIGAAAWAIYTATMFYVMPRVTLEVLGAFRAVAVITAVSAVVGTTLIATLLLLAPPAWSLLGALASELLVLVLCWVVAHRLLLALSPQRITLVSGFARPPSPRGATP